MVWVQMREGADDLDADSVRAFCTGKLAHYKIPRYVHVVDAVPDDSHGQGPQDRDARTGDRIDRSGLRVCPRTQGSVSRYAPRSRSPGSVLDSVASTRRRPSPWTPRSRTVSLVCSGPPHPCSTKFRNRSRAPVSACCLLIANAAWSLRCTPTVASSERSSGWVSSTVHASVKSTPAPTRSVRPSRSDEAW